MDLLRVGSGAALRTENLAACKSSRAVRVTPDDQRTAADRPRVGGARIPPRVRPAAGEGDLRLAHRALGRSEPVPAPGDLGVEPDRRPRARPERPVRRLPVPDGAVVRGRARGRGAGVDRRAPVDGDDPGPGRVGHRAPARRRLRPPARARARRRRRAVHRQPVRGHLRHARHGDAARLRRAAMAAAGGQAGHGRTEALALARGAGARARRRRRRGELRGAVLGGGGAARAGGVEEVFVGGSRAGRRASFLWRSGLCAAVASLWWVVPVLAELGRRQRLPDRSPSSRTRSCSPRACRSRCA